MATVTVVTDVNDSDFIRVQVEALPISVRGCPVHVHSPPPEQSGLCALAGAACAGKAFLGLLWNDEACVSHPRTEMIPSGESGVQILKGGI